MLDSPWNYPDTFLTSHSRVGIFFVCGFNCQGRLVRSADADSELSKKSRDVKKKRILNCLLY